MSYDFHGALAAGYTPAEIAEDLAAHPVPGGIDIAAARQAGYTDDEIIRDEAANQPKNLLGAVIGAKAGNAVHDTLQAVTPGSVQRGAAHMVEGMANTADMFGATGVGGYLHRQVNQEQLNAPSSQDALGKAWHDGSYGQVLANLPGAVGEAVPQIAGQALGAAAGGAIGGPAGFVAGAGADALLGIVTQAGDIAKARAKADGRTEVNDQDIAIAVSSSGILGSLDRIGLGKAAGSLVATGVKNLLGRGAAGKIATGIGSAAVHGATDAVQSVGVQAAETAGTQQGLTIDPDAVAAQAITGAGARAALGGARTAMDLGTGELVAQRRAAAAEAARKSYESASPEDQAGIQNTAAAAKLLADTRDADTQNPVKPGNSVAARTATAGYARDLGAMVDSWTKGDTAVLDPTHRDALRGLIEDARNTQRASDPARVADTLSQTGLPAADQKAFADGVAQLDMLSTAGVRERNTSRLGSVLGAAGGFLGVQTPHPFLGAQIGSQLGAGIGNKISRALRFSDPKLVSEGMKAATMLEAAGVPIPQTRAGLVDAIGQSHDAIQTQAKMLGLDPGNYGFSKAEQRAIALDAAKDAANSNTAQADAATIAPTTTLEGRMAAAAEMQRQAASQSAPGGSAMPPATVVATNRSNGSSTAPEGSAGLSELQPTRQPDQGFDSSLGKRLPDWQYGVANDLHKALNLSGLPKNLNYAQEALKALGQVRDEGHIDGALHDAIAKHHGRLVEGVFNLIRNQALLNHGIDRRHADAQQPALAVAAE